MDQLALHIEYLLRRNDCVILPGIGAFINAHTPAHFDSASSKWIPMTQEVRFNPAIIQEDGLLANSYARKYTLPFHDARNLLEADIKHFLTLLKEDGEVTIGRIGRLSKAENSSLLFTPLQSSSYMNRELGLIPVANDFAIAENCGSAKRETIIFKKEETPAIEDCNIDVTDNEGSDNASHRRFDTKRNYYIPINKIFAKISASLILVFVLTLFVLFRTEDRFGEDRASVLPVEEIVDTTASLAGIRSAHTASEAANNKISEDSIAEDTSSKENICENKSSHKFYLIVGTFKTEQEAERYINHLEGTHKNLSIIPSSTLFRVSIASSDDKSELLTELNSSAVAETFAGAWIWENKNAK